MQTYAASTTLDFDVRPSVQFLRRFCENSGKQQQNSEPPRCNSDRRLGGGPAIPRSSQRHPLIIRGTNIGWGYMPEDMVREDVAEGRLVQLDMPELKRGSQ